MSERNGAPWGPPRPTDTPPPDWAPAPGYAPGPAAPPGYGTPPGHGAPPGHAPFPGQVGPGYGPPGYGPPGYGPPGYGPPGYGATAIRHRPGAGFGIGIAGFVLALLSLVSFPWISEGGQDATFADIGESLDAMNDYGLGLSPELEYLEMYTSGLWIVILGLAGVALVFSTLVVPSSHGGRMATGFLVAGVLGLVINAFDRAGRVAPRLTGALVALGCLGMHGAAVHDAFDADFTPDAAWGVWAGVVGLLLVLVGCLVGTRTERVPTYR